jgi:hypothetical protein
MQPEVHHLHLVPFAGQVFESFAMVHGFQRGAIAPENGLSKSDMQTQTHASNKV